MPFTGTHRGRDQIASKDDPSYRQEFGETQTSFVHVAGSYLPSLDG